MRRLPSVVALDWERDGLTLAALRERLSGSSGGRVAVTAIPNARLHRELAVTRLMRDGAIRTAGSLRAALPESSSAIDPEVLWCLGEETGHHVAVRWSGNGTAGTCEAVFAPQAEADDWPSFGPLAMEAVAGSEFANQPNHGMGEGNLAQELRSFLRERLPEYMVPSAFVSLDAIPRTPNGKVDRRALPAPDPNSWDVSRRFVAPKTPTEQLLADIWAQVLRVDRVSADASIFDLGGDSLLIFQITTRANQAGLRCTPKQVFQHRTIAELAAALSDSGAEPVKGTVAPAIVPVSRETHRRKRQAV